MNCPSCGHLSTEDFGLVTCASCQHQFMVNVDEPAHNSESNATEPPQSFYSFPLDQSQNSTDNLEDPVAAFVERRVDAEASDEFSESENHEVVPPELPPTPEKSAVGDMKVSHPQFADVVAFGNSPASQATGGTLSYDVRITGVDSSEIRDELKLILGEPRLRLDVDQLLRSIEGGELTLRDLTSVKAAYLVKELLHLSVDVAYAQKGIFKDG